MRKSKSLKIYIHLCELLLCPLYCTAVDWKTATKAPTKQEQKRTQAKQIYYVIICQTLCWENVFQHDSMREKLMDI